MNDEREHTPSPPLNTAFLLILGLAAPLLQLTSFLFMGSLGLAPGLATAGMATLLTYGLLFSICAARIPEPVGPALGFVPARRLAWIAVPLLLTSLLLSSELDNIVRELYPIPEAANAAERSDDPALLAASQLLVQILVFPLAYELFFRGMMQPVIVAERGAAAGIALTALLSGIALSMGLVNPWAILPSSLNALVLGILRHGAGSIAPGLLLHALGGALSVVASYRLLGVPGFDDTSVAHTPLGWLVGAALCTGVGLRLCRAGSGVSASHRELRDK